ncbi:hypothetical protein [Treponema phagedenis]|uniref:Putative heat shock protein n=2 Tax=Treponema phagedenis TaxID=162 RepID=O07889_TREPH|nr:hypothetical protein [Treponema phagedenis]AAB61248.1 putative heat shock protein [Treponema phagedenis]
MYMKTALKVAAVVFGSFIILLPIISVVYSFVEFFSFDTNSVRFTSIFLRSVCVLSPSICILSVLIAYTYIMRHSKKKLLSFVFFIIALSICLFGLIPLLFYANSSKTESYTETVAAAVSTDTKLENFIAPPAILNPIIEPIKEFNAYFQQSFDFGLTTYFLCAALLFFLFCGSGLLLFITNWKMLNAIFILCFSLSFFLLFSTAQNPLYFIKLQTLLPMQVVPPLVIAIYAGIVACCIYLFSGLVALLAALQKKVKRSRYA